MFQKLYASYDVTLSSWWQSIHYLSLPSRWWLKCAELLTPDIRKLLLKLRDIKFLEINLIHFKNLYPRSLCSSGRGSSPKSFSRVPPQTSGLRCRCTDPPLEDWDQTVWSKKPKSTIVFAQHDGKIVEDKKNENKKYRNNKCKVNGKSFRTMVSFSL